MVSFLNSFILRIFQFLRLLKTVIISFANDNNFVFSFPVIIPLIFALFGQNNIKYNDAYKNPGLACFININCSYTVI